MKKVIFLILGGIVVTLVILGIRASIERAQTTTMTIEDIQKQDGIPVVTIKAERRDLLQKRSFTGAVKGIDQVDASAMIMEKIETFRVALGDRVSEGQILLTLDRQNPTARYRQAEDALAEAKRELERSRNLLNAGAISQQMHDKSVLAEKIAQADFDAINRMLEVRAPIEGIITDIFLEKGETVSPGISILRIANLNRVITEIEVGESDIALIKKGQKAEVRTNSFPGMTFTGSISAIALSIDPAARNFLIKIEIPNPGNLLKPGMFTVVDVIVGEASDVIAVPADALVKENGNRYIYIVTSDMTAQKVPINPGIIDGEWVEIEGDVSVGDTVVLEGQNRLSNGSKVIIVS